MKHNVQRKKVSAAKQRGRWITTKKEQFIKLTIVKWMDKHNITPHLRLSSWPREECEYDNIYSS